MEDKIIEMIKKNEIEKLYNYLKDNYKTCNRCEKIYSTYNYQMNYVYTTKDNHKIGVSKNNDNFNGGYSCIIKNDYDTIDSIGDLPAIIKIYDNSISREWFKNGLIHRECGPASMKDYSNGDYEYFWAYCGANHNEKGPAIIRKYNNKCRVAYLIDGLYHREDGPADITAEDGKLVTMTYYKKGLLHRVDGPAEIYFYNDGSKYYNYYVDNKLHNEEGSASVEYYSNGRLKFCQYLKDDIIVDSIDGPSSIEYYENGNKKVEEWFKDDKLHRLDGPAKIKYNEDGTIREELWFREGLKLDELQVIVLLGNC